MGLLKPGKIIVSLLLFVARFSDSKARARRWAVPGVRRGFRREMGAGCVATPCCGGTG